MVTKMPAALLAALGAMQAGTPLPAEMPHKMAGMSGMDAAGPVCPTEPAAPPAEMAGWTRRPPVRAGNTAAKAMPLALGAGATATLLPTPRIAYPLRPEKPGGSVSYGGLFAFAAPAAGRYRVAIGSGAWIDVVRDGQAAVSIAHGHGPACTGIAKMVDFDLAPGRYLLQIAANGAATLPLMVVRLP